MGNTPYITQRQLVALKIEAAEGVGETLAAGDVVTPTFENDYTPNIEMLERNNLQPSFSRIAQVSGEQSGVITFQTEIKGSGTAGTPPPHLDVALKACGMDVANVAATSDTYSPISEAIPSVTIELREYRQNGEGKIKRLEGARGTWSLSAEKGMPIMITFVFTGRYVKPTDPGAKFASPTPGPLPPIMLDAAFSLHGVGTLRASAISIDMQNNVILRNDLNETTGNFSGLIVDRQPVATIDPEAEPISSIDFYDKWVQNAVGILTFKADRGAGNIVTITAPKAQITGVAEGDRDGIRTSPLDLQLNQDDSPDDDGDNELAITFT